MRELVNQAAPLAVVGYGHMGVSYVRTLLESGVDPSDLTVVDINPTVLAKVPQGIKTMGSVAELTETPKSALVLVNTPFHLSVLTELFSRGTRNFFVEKPLVHRGHELDGVLGFVQAGANIYTAYLINFSLAVDALTRFMRERDLVLYEVKGLWGKNRTFDTRMSPGDLEDEMVHMVRLSLLLLESREAVSDVTLSASLSHLSFVNPEAQALARSRDDSIPERPNSSANLAMNFSVANRVVRAFLTSSFVSAEQRRLVDVVLGRPDCTEVTHLGTLRFDQGGKDFLFLQEACKKDGEVTSLEFPSGNKVRDEVAAFLRATTGGDRDPRLTGFAAAAESVRITEAAIESNSRGRVTRP